MSRIIEKRGVSWHDNCICKFRLVASVCNNKNRWNNDKCICDCKELNIKGECDNGFI